MHRPIIELVKVTPPHRHASGTLFTMLPTQLRLGDHVIRGFAVRKVESVEGTHVEHDDFGAPTTFVDLLVSNERGDLGRWQLDTSAVVMVLR
jgi:hypothetical protein